MTRNLPVITSDYRIRKSGRFFRFTTEDSGFAMEFDGRWLGVIKLPTSYAGKVTGMCGNFNGVREDDLVTKTGQNVTGDPNADILIGNSWQTDSNK